MTTGKTSKRQIRDFIYIDIPRLYSMYAQQFGKIPHEVVSVRAAEKGSRDSAAARLSGSSAETNAREQSQEIEKSYLYDHMYNQLEGSLSPSIIDASHVTAENLLSTFSTNVLIRAQGEAEVEDYQRLRIIFENYQKIGQAIAYAGNVEKVEELQKQITQESDSRVIKSLKNEITKLQDLKLQAQLNGLAPDMININNLDLFASTFNPQGFEVLITPSHSPRIQYRAVIDRRWLRYEPDLLRALYGGKSLTPWTVVGQVTLIPSQATKETEPKEQEATAAELALLPAPDTSSMRDAFRGLFRSSRYLERMFVLSKQAVEIIISPYAMYREIDLPAVKDDPPAPVPSSDSP